MTPLDSKYWNTRYQTKKTAWDIGYAAPAIVTWLLTLKTNNPLKIAIPGAGNAYEAEHLFKLYPQHQVYIFDIADEPLQAFSTRLPQFPKSQILKANVLQLGKSFDSFFDVIIEHTFFCALHPNLRTRYFKCMLRYLKPGGTLVGLWFNDFFNALEPPFGAHKHEYLKLIPSEFKIEIFETCYNSIPARQHREWGFKLVKLI